MRKKRHFTSFQIISFIQGFSDCDSYRQLSSDAAHLRPIRREKATILGLPVYCNLGCLCDRPGAA